MKPNAIMILLVLGFLASVSWGLAGTPLWLNFVAALVCIAGGVLRLIWLRHPDLRN
jgi:hypothetical protein